VVATAGGLYEASQAAQGKAGSATDVMCPAKLKISGQGRCEFIMTASIPSASLAGHSHHNYAPTHFFSLTSAHREKVRVSDGACCALGLDCSSREWALNQVTLTWLNKESCLAN